MDKLGLSDYIIKVNHRQELINKLISSGVPDELLLTTCSSIDKLDKQTWEEIEEELYQKGLSKSTVSLIRVSCTESSSVPGKWLFTLMSNARNLMFDNKIEYVPTLARGMDYYTGLIYEIVYPSSTVGSIISGGRYDNLTRMYRPVDLPMCGISIGLDRIMELGIKITRSSNSSSSRYLICRTSNNLIDIKKQLSDLMTTSKAGKMFEIEYKARSRSKHNKYAKKNKRELLN